MIHDRSKLKESTINCFYMSVDMLLSSMTNYKLFIKKPTQFCFSSKLGMFYKASTFKFSSVPTHIDLGTYNVPGIVYLGYVNKDTMGAN